MGDVYRARGTRLARTVAIKLLRSEFVGQADFRHRFEREARAISALNHPHIVTLHEVAADLLDTDVTSQAFDKRFTPAAADFFHNLLLEGFNRSFNSLRPALLPVLRRFTATFLRDATLVSLPSVLASAFPGRGGRHTPPRQRGEQRAGRKDKEQVCRLTSRGGAGAV